MSTVEMWRALWSRSLVWHALVLTLMLLVGLWWSRPGIAWSADEGATVLQVAILRDAGSWSFEPEMTSVDPEGEAQPFPHGEESDEGIAPFAKHPVHVTMLRGLAAVAGPAWYPLLSVAGTVVAAVAAAAVAREVSPGGERATLWLVGIASPLLFDSFLLLAHTLAAAAAALALLALVRHLVVRPSALALAGLAAASAAALLVRTEGGMVGIAMAGAAGVAWLGRQAPLRRAAPAAVAAVAGTAAAFAVERLWRADILGEGSRVVPRTSGSWIAGRAESFVATWLDPGYVTGDRADLVLVAAVVALAVAVLALRRGPSASRVAFGALVVGASGYLLRLVIAQPDAIPGLLMACPWLLVLLAVTRDNLSGIAARLAASAAGIVALGVLLTQYERGGGLEWGGRYFALAIPLVAPVVVRIGSRLWTTAVDPARVRPMVGLLLVIPLVLAVAGLEDLRAKHDGARAVAGLLGQVDDAPGRAEVDGRAVVFGPGGQLLPQIVWPTFDDHVWLVPSMAHAERYARRLAVEGVVPVAVFGADARRLVDDLGWEVVDEWRDGDLVLVLARPA